MSYIPYDHVRVTELAPPIGQYSTVVKGCDISVKCEPTLAMTGVKLPLINDCSCSDQNCNLFLLCIYSVAELYCRLDTPPVEAVKVH